MVLILCVQFQFLGTALESHSEMIIDGDRRGSVSTKVSEIMLYDCGEAKRFSSRTIKRFCSEHGLNRSVS